MQSKALNLSRRDLIKQGAVAAAGVGGLVALANCTPTLAETADEAERIANGETIERVTAELPIPSMPAPTTTEYECDVLVIGGGFAGLNAAVAAKEAGCDVLLIDKGTPGYSGLSSWPGTYAWFDPDYDDWDACRESIIRGGEFMANQKWLDIWLNESKASKERLEGWGFFGSYGRASDVDDINGGGTYWENNDYAGYYKNVVGSSKQAVFMNVLQDKDIPVVTHTMITKVVVDDGKVKGAIGFDVPSATPIQCHAKAVVMCMGQGAYKVQGWPTSADTFDGEYIAYQLGLAICNKETEDYHGTNNTNPGNALMGSGWNYLENFFFCPISSVDPEDPNAYSRGQCRFILYSTKYVDGVGMSTAYSHTPGDPITTPEENGGDIRTGKRADNNWGDGTSRFNVTGGASIGFCGHLMPGVHCDWDDDCGFTGINGLYVAGDGMNAAPPNGFGYGQIHGLTSSFCSVEGYHAGNAAGEYALGLDLEKIPSDIFEEESANILGPLERAQSDEGSFDPTWCINVLASIMSPYWAVYSKTDTMLNAALLYVEKLRDEVLPKLGAANAHDVRLCQEAIHKVTSAEMKLRAGLARKESRGFCFHEDYQYRKDDEFLCLMGCVKQEDGTMGVEKFPLPDDWVGDLNEDYNTRYPNPFPLEEEDLKKIGIDVVRPEPTLVVSAH